MEPRVGLDVTAKIKFLHSAGIEPQFVSSLAVLARVVLSLWSSPAVILGKQPRIDMLVKGSSKLLFFSGPWCSYFIDRDISTPNSFLKIL
jgi:hypothetical protein